MLHVALYGLDESVPTCWPLAKNSTREIEPSLSDALAASATDAGAVNVEFVAGAVRVTDGARLVGAVGTRTVTLVKLAVEVALTLWLVTARPT